jgi:hypothetical protein
MLEWQREIPKVKGLWWRRTIGTKAITPVDVVVVIAGVAYDDDFDEIQPDDRFEWAGPDVDESED